jgi:hypothetical protein
MARPAWAVGRAAIRSSPGSAEHVPPRPPRRRNAGVVQQASCTFPRARPPLPGPPGRRRLAGLAFATSLLPCAGDLPAVGLKDDAARERASVRWSSTRSRPRRPSCSATGAPSGAACAPSACGCGPTFGATTPRRRHPLRLASRGTRSGPAAGVVDLQCMLGFILVPGNKPESFAGEADEEPLFVSSIFDRAGIHAFPARKFLALRPDRPLNLASARGTHHSTTSDRQSGSMQDAASINEIRHSHPGLDLIAIALERSRTTQAAGRAGS